MNAPDYLTPVLEVAVRLRMHSFANAGGPSEDDFKRAQAFGQVLAEKGDRLLHRVEAETAEVFNGLADALAVMSFVPGGVKFGALHFIGKPLATAAT